MRSVTNLFLLLFSIEEGGHLRNLKLKWGRVASKIKDGAYQCRSIFARFMSMWEKQILARATEIQKETLG